MTDDGGSTWKSQKSDATSDLKSITCPSTNLCFGVSSEQVISVNGRSGTLVAKDELSSSTTSPDLTHLLQKSQTVMAKLHSATFRLGTATEFYDNAGTRLNDKTLIINAMGGMIAPDLSSLRILETSTGLKQRMVFGTLIQKDNVYVSRENGYDVISKEKFLAFDDARLYIEAGMPQVSALIDLSLQKGTLHDAIGGFLPEAQNITDTARIRHIQVTFQQDISKDLQALGIDDDISPRLSTNPNTHSATIIDFWIDRSTGYVYQAYSETIQPDTLSIRYFRLTFITFNTFSFQIPDHATPISSPNQYFDN